MTNLDGYHYGLRLSPRNKIMFFTTINKKVLSHVLETKQYTKFYLEVQIDTEDQLKDFIDFLKSVTTPEALRFDGIFIPIHFFSNNNIKLVGELYKTLKKLKIKLT
jgi:hypothetical protein